MSSGAEARSSATTLRVDAAEDRSTTMISNRSAPSSNLSNGIARGSTNRSHNCQLTLWIFLLMWIRKGIAPSIYAQCTA